MRDGLNSRKKTKKNKNTLILAYPIAFPLYWHCNSTFFRPSLLLLSTNMMLLLLAEVGSDLGSVAAKAVGVERLVVAVADRTSS